MEPAKILRKPAVKQRYGDLPDSTLYDWIAKGLFPRPVRLCGGSRAVGWIRSELDAHDRRRLAERDGGGQ
jgi:predicted DNA-binding transcriptional regulator AlpA